MDKPRTASEDRPTQLQIEAQGKIDQAISEAGGEKRVYRPFIHLSPAQKLQVEALQSFFRQLTSPSSIASMCEDLPETEIAKIRKQNDSFRANYHQLDGTGVIEFVGLEAADFSVDDHFFALEQVQNGFDFNSTNDPSGLHSSGTFHMPNGSEMVWIMFFSNSLSPYTPQSKELLTAKNTKRHVWVFTLEDLENFTEFHEKANDSKTVTNTPETVVPLP